jgi:pimeloyl-ACP methyl ester carboxylesterase
VVVSSRIVANGVALVVHDWGGSGEPVLLAHPTGFHGRVWAPIAQRLIANGRRVWSFDFRGHGDSDAPDIEYAWAEFADDVTAVARHLGIAGDRSLLACGHSKGAAALLLAEVAEPATFPRIWAYEPIVFATETALPPAPDFPMSKIARRRRNAWQSTDEAFAAYRSKPPLDVMTVESLRAYVDYGLRDRGDGVLELKCSPEVEARVYAMGPNHGLWTRLPEIDANVRVVCGERSTDIGPTLARAIADRLPNGRLEVVPGVGHFGPQQDPDAAVASMLAFAAQPGGS